MTEIAAFLRDAGWATAERQPLDQDASSRRYERLRMGDETAILMIDPDGDVARFELIARHLLSLGLSAPRILSSDPAQGFMVLEDLGSGLFARLLEGDPAEEAALYQAAADVLMTLHRAPPVSGLVRGTPDRLAQMVDLGLELYCPEVPAPAQRAITQAFEDVLNTYAPTPDVTILRDYHAENLLWLPDRSGAARVGLLDFQDAMIGHRAYDLVSLLQDARRDVSADTVARTIRYVLDQTGAEAQPFEAAYAALGAQRQLRILGIFVRLAQTRGKPKYLELIPRVQAHLMACLSHPALQEVSTLLRPHLPEPTRDFLASLSRPCPTP